MDFKGRSFLKLLDFSADEISCLIDFAAELKYKKKAGIPHRLCEGKNIVLLFEKEIRAIFARIIEKRIALEVNTSGIGDRFGELMPSVPLLALYREMGGELLTIGSDAHVPHRVGNALEDTKAVLRELGFSTYCYYKNRKTQFVVL